MSPEPEDSVRDEDAVLLVERFNCPYIEGEPPINYFEEGAPIVLDRVVTCVDVWVPTPWFAPRRPAHIHIEETQTASHEQSGGDDE